MNSFRRISPLVTLTASVLAYVVCASTAHALVELGSGRITFRTTGTALYDSYLIGTADRGDDYVYTVSPQLSYNHLVGPTGLQLFGGYSINRYQKHSRLDSNDFSGGISSNFPVYEGSRLSGRLSANYIEATQIDPIVNDRVPTKSYQFSLSAGYRTGVKTTLSDSVNYNRSMREIYGNQTMWSNNLSFEYADFLENTNLTLSHGYTRTKSTASNYSAWVVDPELLGIIPNSDIDQTGNTFNLGLTRPLYGSIIGNVTYGYMILSRGATETWQHSTSDKSQVFGLNITGPLLPPRRFPKIESSASISYSQAQSPGINDAGSKTVTGDIRLSWNARERTRLSTGLSRSQSLGTNNFTFISTGVNFGVIETIGLSTTISFDTSYTWRQYRGLDRQDTALSVGGNLQHALTNHWSIGGNVNYQDNQTDAPSGSFQATRYFLENYTRYTASGYITFSY
ncbi:MAG: outer membrane beta-barrel protein [Nibricoccus sp.]